MRCAADSETQIVSSTSLAQASLTPVIEESSIYPLIIPISQSGKSRSRVIVTTLGWILPWESKGETGQWRRSLTEILMSRWPSFIVLLDSFDLAEKLYWLGVHYNTAQIGVEMAMTGFAVNSGLQRLGYSNLYIWRHREKAFPTLSSYSGWKTQTDSKAHMLAIFRELVNKGQLRLHSHLLWNEMADYVRVPGADPRFDSYRGNLGHDDAVMSCGITLVIGDDEAAGLNRSPTAERVVDRATLIQEALRTGAACVPRRL